MSSKRNSGRFILPMARVLISALMAAGVILSGRPADFIQAGSLVFVLAGGIAVSLTGFAVSEILFAFKHAAGIPGNDPDIRRSAQFWESSARNFWMLGVLGSVLHFVAAMGSLQGGIPGIATAMARSLLATFYGMVLAAACYVPYWKLAGSHANTSPGLAGHQEGKGSQGGEAPGLSSAIGYGLFFAVLASALIRSPLSESWAALNWILYWPSLLVVFGGALLLISFLGKFRVGSMITLSFAVTGLIGSLLGFIQALHGFASGKIEEIAAAITFILSSCFAALLGMLLLGAPLEDRESGEPRQSSVGRVAWYVFPMVAFILLILMFVMIITPITKPG